jgi:methyl-accepting chemotaxis protein
MGPFCSRTITGGAGARNRSLRTKICAVMPAAQRTSDTVGDTCSAAEELTSTAGQLHDLVSRFRH